MNERIQQLALQASTTTTSYYDGRGNVTETIFDKEKFAELIVRECCSAIRLDDVFNGGKFQRTILQHFGVEE